MCLSLHVHTERRGKKEGLRLGPGLEVIKLEYSLKLKIKCNDMLLADTCPQAANHCALFRGLTDLSLHWSHINCVGFILLWFNFVVYYSAIRLLCRHVPSNSRSLVKFTEKGTSWACLDTELIVE